MTKYLSFYVNLSIYTRNNLIILNKLFVKMAQLIRIKNLIEYSLIRINNLIEYSLIRIIRVLQIDFVLLTFIGTYLKKIK